MYHTYRNHHSTSYTVIQYFSFLYAPKVFLFYHNPFFRFFNYHNYLVFSANSLGLQRQMNSFNKQRMPKWSSVNAEVMTEGDNLQELGKTQKIQWECCKRCLYRLDTFHRKSTHFPGSRAEKKSAIYEDFYENRIYQEAESR